MELNIELTLVLVAVIIVAAYLVLDLSRANVNKAVLIGAIFGTVLGLLLSLITGIWTLLALAFMGGTFIGTVYRWIGRIV